MRDRTAYFVITLLGLSVMFFLLWQVREPLLTGRNDFIPLYVAGKLAGTGSLYDSQAYYGFMVHRFAALHESLRFTRPPFYAALLWPLSRLPYGTAYLVWWLLRLAALGGFLLLWRIPSRRETLVFVALSVPLFASLAAGQDVVFLLLLISAAVRRHAGGKDFQAGLAFSLCAIKFHLFILLPLLFWKQRLSRMAAGFAAGAAALLALTFAVEGPRWMHDYFLVLMDNRVHPGADAMPNLHGLLAALPGAPYLEAAAAVALIAAAWFAMGKASFADGVGLMLLGGLLLSYHSYLMDAAILLPACLAVFAHTHRRWIKLGGALLLSPPFALLLVSSPPWSYVTQAGLTAFFAAISFDISTRADSPAIPETWRQKLSATDRAPLPLYPQKRL